MYPLKSDSVPIGKLCGSPGFILALLGIHLVASGLRPPPVAMVLSQGGTSVCVSGRAFQEPFHASPRLVPPEKCLKMLPSELQTEQHLKQADPALSDVQTAYVSEQAAVVPVEEAFLQGWTSCNCCRSTAAHHQARQAAVSPALGWLLGPPQSQLPFLVPRRSKPSSIQATSATHWKKNFFGEVYLPTQLHTSIPMDF